MSKTTRKHGFYKEKTMKEADYRIWKYPLRIEDVQTLCLPRGRVLSVQQQGRDPMTLTMWVLTRPASLNDDVRDARLHVCIIGTGNPCDSMEGMEFAGTVQATNGLVWHVFYCWEDQRPV